MDTLLTNHDLLYKLQDMGFKVDPIMNKHTGRYSETLVAVNDLLCYMLPMYNSPRILSSTVIDDTDFIIAANKMGDLVDYYIIPSNFVAENKDHYPLPFREYKNAWKFLTL